MNSNCSPSVLGNRRCASVCLHVYMFMHTCARRCMHACVQVHTHVHACACMCVHVCSIKDHYCNVWFKSGEWKQWEEHLWSAAVLDWVSAGKESLIVNNQKESRGESKHFLPLNLSLLPFTRTQFLMQKNLFSVGLKNCPLSHKCLCSCKAFHSWQKIFVKIFIWSSSGVEWLT